jgi:hypothetical protein
MTADATFLARMERGEIREQPRRAARAPHGETRGFVGPAAGRSRWLRPAAGVELD